MPSENLKATMAYRPKLLALIDAIANSDESNKHDDLNAVEAFFQDCGGYVNAVVHMESAIIIARDCMEAPLHQEHLAQLDASCHHAHEALIAAIKLLTRLCQLYRVEPIYTGPFEHFPIAEFAMRVAGEMFAERNF